MKHYRKKSIRWVWVGVALLFLYAIQMGVVLYYVNVPFHKTTTPEGIEVGVYQNVTFFDYIPVAGLPWLLVSVYADNEECVIWTSYRGQANSTGYIDQLEIPLDHIKVERAASAFVVTYDGRPLGTFWSAPQTWYHMI